MLNKRKDLTMKRILSIFIGIFISTLFISAGETSGDLTFEDWDKNEDALISRSEFVERFTANYVDDWNIKDDEHLDDEDFFLSTYNIWDTDDDELLSEEEWLFGYDYYYGDYAINDYLAVDTDGDGFIEYAEYYNYLNPTDFYIVWDVDKDTYLNEFELARVVFNNWDINENNFIEKDEYVKFDTYYLDI